jgi:hypothetical protein
MKRQTRIALLQVCLDAAMALLAAFVAYQVRFHILPDVPPIPGGEPPAPDRYLGAAPVQALILVAVFLLLGVYRQRRGVDFVDELLAVGWAMAVTTVVTFAGIGIYREGVGGQTFQFSRITAAYWVVIAAVLCLIARYGLRRYLAGRRARGLGADRALIVGWSSSAEALVQRIRMFPSYGYRVIGVLTDRSGLGDRVAGLPVLGHLEDLGHVVVARHIAVVFVALGDVEPTRTLEVIEECRGAGVDIRILPGIIQLMTGPVGADQIEGIPLIEVRQGLELAGTKTALKRGFDLVFAARGRGPGPSQLAGPDPDPSASGREGRAHVSGPQVPQHAGGRRGAERAGVGVGRRSAAHARRQVAAALLGRRAAAALERRPGGDEPRRTASRASGVRPPVRGRPAPLRRPAPGAARPHRVGTGQRPTRTDPDRGPSDL